MSEIFGIPVIADPHFLDGVIALRSDDGRWESLWHLPPGTSRPGPAPLISLAEFTERCESDPALAEDCYSLVESSPFVVRLDDAGGRMDCERCGTPVAAVPEAHAALPPDERKWCRAVWEPELGRKHTLRRCEAMQALPPRSPEPGT